MINVKVKNDKKSLLNEDKEINAQIEKITKELGNNGRVVIRPSGTEPLIRVMIEGQQQQEIDTYATQIADLIKSNLGVNPQKKRRKIYEYCRRFRTSNTTSTNISNSIINIFRERT